MKPLVFVSGSPILLVTVSMKMIHQLRAPKLGRLETLAIATFSLDASQLGNVLRCISNAPESLRQRDMYIASIERMSCKDECFERGYEKPIPTSKIF